jgi:hypothetical protein
MIWSAEGVGAAVLPPQDDVTAAIQAMTMNNPATRKARPLYVCTGALSQGVIGRTLSGRAISTSYIGRAGAQAVTSAGSKLMSVVSINTAAWRRPAISGLNGRNAAAPKRRAARGI